MATTETRPHENGFPVAMQFDEPWQQKAAVSLGMWIFLATEVIFFGGMFLGYIVYRYQFPLVFSAGGQHLNTWFGGVMMAILLTGSLLMSLSDNRIALPGDDNDKRGAIFRMLLITVLLGVVFLGIEFYEYYELIRKGLFPGDQFRMAHFANKSLPGQSVQMFFVLYFCMTGLHAVHMIIGVSLVGGLAVVVRCSQRLDSLQSALTVIGLYWSFVDIIWIFLYPLFYLIPELK